MTVKRRVLVVLSLVLLLLMSVLNLTAQDITGDFPQEIAEDLQRVIGNLTRGNVPGMAVLVDTPDGAFSMAGGMADVENEIPLAPDDSFRVGSITKMFTSVLILQLQEDGVLSIDDTLDMWLPEIAERLPYGDEITLHHLLTHTSGVYNITNDFNFVSEILSNPEREWTPQEVIDWVIDNNEPSFAPGTEGAWSYSNTGYVLLGMVIESAGGRPLAELYRERIFEPLGMTSAYLADSEEATSALVQGYTGRQNISNWNATSAWSGGAIVANTADLNTFIRGLFDGALFQNPETLTLMTTPLDPESENVYGLGIGIYGDGIWGHGGETPGFLAHLVYSQNTDTVVVVLANNDGFNLNNITRFVEPLLVDE